ncbi:MAG: septum formation initiator family protein [Lachnospiraceae bacterium]|nr:septum formation initiator family protein [Lachnospiraceae bacterium]
MSNSANIRKRAEKIRKRRQRKQERRLREQSVNKLSMVLVSLVVFAITMLVTVGGKELKSKIDKKDEQLNRLNQEYELEQKRTEEIEEYGKYTQTMGFVEEEAKDKLNLVHDNEIQFREEK